jgi:hypothetical protein
MSYPSSLDLAFGSEKATADPIGRLSFGSGNSDLPKTSEELHQLAQEGLAFFVVLYGDGTLDLSDEEHIPSTVVETLPGNLKGVVIEDPEDMSITPCTCTVSTDPLVITLNSVPVGAKGASIILRQAVNTENP